MGTQSHRENQHKHNKQDFRTNDSSSRSLVLTSYFCSFWFSLWFWLSIDPGIYLFVVFVFSMVLATHRYWNLGVLTFLWFSRWFWLLIDPEILVFLFSMGFSMVLVMLFWFASSQCHLECACWKCCFAIAKQRVSLNTYIYIYIYIYWLGETLVFKSGVSHNKTLKLLKCSVSPRRDANFQHNICQLWGHHSDPFSYVCVYVSLSLSIYIYIHTYNIHMFINIHVIVHAIVTNTDIDNNELTRTHNSMTRRGSSTLRTRRSSTSTSTTMSRTSGQNVAHQSSQEWDGKVPLTIPARIQWSSDSESMSIHLTATETPQWLLRCRLLVCPHKLLFDISYTRHMYTLQRHLPESVCQAAIYRMFFPLCHSIIYHAILYIYIYIYIYI